ncbi:MAG: YciI family protein [Ferruginibacter sp.]
MKAILLFFMLFTILVNGNAQNKYDSVLAKKLNADEYGMKTYVLVILKAGTAKVEKVVEDSLFAGHMKNIGRLAADGKLVLAGPLGKNDLNYRGIFILNTSSIDEARTMVDTDPTVKNNLLAAEYITWYGSAAVMQIPDTHKKIQKTSF